MRASLVIDAIALRSTLSDRTHPYVLLLLPIALQGATLIMMLANPNNKMVSHSIQPELSGPMTLMRL